MSLGPLRSLSATVPLLAALGLVACGSAHGSSEGSVETAAAQSTGAALALHGAYVPTSDSGRAEYASLSFTSATAFTAVKASCRGSSRCRVDGSYVYDGAHDLALTDAATGATEHVSFVPSATSATASDADAAGSSSTPQAVHPLDGLLDGSGGGTGLVGPTAGSLLPPTVTAATVDGTSMQHLAEDDPPARSTGPLVVPLTSTGTATVTLKVGRHGTPVEAILDTGSSGIWIARSLLDPRDGIDQQETASTGYGASQSLSGEVVSAFVTLGGIRTLGVIPVGVVTSATCLNGNPCDDGSSQGIDQITLAGGPLHAVVGIGMDQGAKRVGIVSPFGSMGQQTEQFILSIGVAGNPDAHLVIDPSSDEIAPFTTRMLTARPDGSGSFITNDVPFCISGACVQGLLDSGETEAVLQTGADADELAALGQMDAPTQVARGFQLTDPVTVSVLGVADTPTASTPEVAGSSVQLRPSAAGNNLGILAFRGLDVFYDAWNGVIGVQPLTP